MSSKSITIDNTLEAIKSGDIPGSFSEDRKAFLFPVLKYVNEKGNTLEWSIEVTLKKSDKVVKIDDSMLVSSNKLQGYNAEINIIARQVDGKVRKNVPTVVTTGKNLGKKNETNVLTQALRDALSLYNKQSKKINTNCVDRPPPMLLQWINDSSSAVLTDSDFKSGVTVQKKYNGVRYVTFYNNNEVVQYSRSGSDYHPAEYINKELQELFNNLPEFDIGKYGIKGQSELDVYKNSIPYLDGELYIHGKSLNYISGQARKESDKDENLHYYVFDVFWPNAIQNNIDMSSKYRQKYLKDLFNKNYKYIHKVETFKVKNLEDLNNLAEKFIKEGYEGAVARKDNKGYKYSFNNYHSSNVLKVKPTYSKEFKVVGYTSGKKGKDFGKVIWICKLDNPKIEGDDTFTVVPNMSLSDRGKLFECLQEKTNSKKNETNFDKYVCGQLLTIEYSEISEKTGKPLQPKAIAFRTYEGKVDPIKDLYEKCGLI